MNNKQKLELIRSAILVMESSEPAFENHRRKLSVDSSHAEWEAAVDADLSERRAWIEKVQNMHKSERLLLDLIMIEDCVELSKEVLKQQAASR